MSPPDVLSPPATPPRLTADQFWRLCQRPENADRRLELIDGEVKDVSRPGRPHGLLVIRIGTLLERWAEAAGRPGYAVTESGLALADDTVVGPDVAYYLDAETFDDVPPKWGDVPPVLAVEVLSPNDKLTEVDDKAARYQAAGVRLVWVIDPGDRRVTVYRSGQPLIVVGPDGELAGGDALPGFACRVADLFRLPGARPPMPPPAPEGSP